jgi:hypothetical protein
MLLLNEMQARASERLAYESALIALGRNNGGCPNGGGGHGAAPGGNDAPPYGYPCPPVPYGNTGTGTHGANFGVQSPSPNQEKTKRKRVTNHGGYANTGANSP